MGNGIAHVFAQNNFKVTLVDIKTEALEKAKATITKNLDRQLAKGSIDESVKTNTLNNILFVSNLEEGAKDADLVIEAATENVNIKLEIFKSLDAICKPECILASNTSSIPITKIGSVTKRPDKVIGMHFMNPVPVMKLVEIIKGF